MQRKKSDWEILYKCPNWKTAWIKQILGYTNEKAKKIHDMAIRIDRQKLGEFIIDNKDPRMETVLDITHIPFSKLEKQIKNAAAESERTAINQ